MKNVSCGQQNIWMRYAEHAERAQAKCTNISAEQLSRRWAAHYKKKHPLNDCKWMSPRGSCFLSFLNSKTMSGRPKYLTGEDLAKNLAGQPSLWNMSIQQNYQCFIYTKSSESNYVPSGNKYKKLKSCRCSENRVHEWMCIYVCLCMCVHIHIFIIDTGQTVSIYT